MYRFFAVRYMLNAAAVVHRVASIHGAVYGYEGRLKCGTRQDGVP